MADGSRSPGSTIAASEFDEQQVTQPSSPTRADPRTTLEHVLGNTDSPQDTPPAAKNTHTNDMTEDEEVRTPGAPGPDAPLSSTATSRKRKDPPPPSGNRDSIYSGNKVKHLKKEDGEPLWRKDIQYDFLKHVFDNKMAVFTNSYDSKYIEWQTFADLYIDAMARSSKTSKILRDKLLTEHEPARNMAMVCLLVNLGRMNTTLNFFPEMRAQLRTYHAIPSLQAHQDPNSYKQLQDAPRLKSILKGASEDRPEPNSLEKLKILDIPRTNPVNLIFVLSSVAPKITELHMPPNHDFYDLLMHTGISSESRARAFLWLMWFYLESDFTEEGAEENPFGAGVDYETDVRNQGVPRIKKLTKEEEHLENVDTPEEIEYGMSKMRERKRIIEADQLAFQAENGPPKRGPKPKLHLPFEEDGQSPSNGLLGRLLGNTPATSTKGGKPKYESDIDSTRSTTPPRNLESANARGGTITKSRAAPKAQVPEGSSPGAQPEGPTPRRPRPLTAHQLAVEQNRSQRIDYILSRGLRKKQHGAKKLRRQEGAIFRALSRAQKVQDPFADSEDEDGLFRENPPFRERGMDGLVQLEVEEEDFGEEVAAYAAAFRRTGRRLERWDSQEGLKLGVMSTTRPKVANGRDTSRGNDETEDERPSGRKRQRNDGDVNMEDEEDLDPMEKELLGLGTEDEDEDLDDVDKALLGIGGDETEEEGENGTWGSVEY